MSRARLAAVAVAALCAAALCGCTSGGTATGSAPPSVGSPVPSTTAPSTTAPSTPGSAGSQSVGPSSPPPAAPNASGVARSTGGAPTPDSGGPPPCPTAALAVRVLRGSAAMQQEFALITFTNTSASTCGLYGHPGVSLRRDHRLLVTATYPANTTARTVVLAPGSSAQTELTDTSTCQAAESDTVRIYPPNQRGYVDRPLVVRGCRISVAAVGRPE